MNLAESIDRYRPQIISSISSVCQTHRSGYGRYGNRTAQMVVDCIEDLAIRGKTVRGVLIMALTAIFLEDQKRDTEDIALSLENALRAATAIELLQTSLLIHDDIIDNDDTRRGVKSAHIRYREQYPDKHTATSIALGTGDLGIFMAQELLASLTGKTAQEIRHRFAREFCRVSIGEIRDVEMPHQDNVSSEEIEEMYRLKTAGYSFALPFCTAGLIAQSDSGILGTLEDIGLAMGVLFQLKDDELGVFGDPSSTGKPVGNDIIERKRTMVIALLLESITLAKNSEDLTIVKDIYGSNNIDQKAKETIINLLKTYNVINKITEIYEEYHNNINSMILHSFNSENSKSYFYDILNFITNRKA